MVSRLFAWCCFLFRNSCLLFVVFCLLFLVVCFLFLFLDVGVLVFFYLGVVVVAVVVVEL